MAAIATRPARYPSEPFTLFTLDLRFCLFLDNLRRCVAAITVKLVGSIQNPWFRFFAVKYAVRHGP